MRCKSRRDAHKKYWVITDGKVPAVQLNLFADKINDEYHEQPGRMKANVMTYSEVKKRNYPNA